MVGIEHGGAIDAAIARYGGQKTDWLDLSTGINPNPYPIGNLPDEVWHTLPDQRLISACLEAALDYYDLPADAGIVAAPGTQAIIQVLPEIWPCERLSIVAPTYGEYERCYGSAGTKLTQIETLADAEGAVVVAGNPNNPDGRLVSSVDVSELVSAGRKVVIDEAFADVCPSDSVTALAGGRPLLVLKSFGKFFGLAGVRLGFAIGDPRIVEQIASRLGPWAVSGPALHIGAKAMRDANWIEASREQLRVDNVRLCNLLTEFGFEIVGSTDLFVSVRHKNASVIADGLAKARILVRTFDYAPDWIRIGQLRGTQEFERLASELRSAI